METPLPHPASALLDALRRYTQAYADAAGVARSPIAGLSAIRATRPSGLHYAISRPLVCLVAQGSKQVSVGQDVHAFSAGDSMLIAGNVPTVSQITAASAEQPYFSFVLELDLELVAELVVEMKQHAITSGPAVRIEPTDSEAADAALRLMQLLERPAALPLLHRQLLREMHYWLLAGRHGPAIRQLGWPDGHAQRIARAVALLRAEFSQTLPTERLAVAAGMSPSSFYQHFRKATSLSPLQFQKQLRLIEARRLMLADDVSASSAAFAVGYESVQQFGREYLRMFGATPASDARARKQAGPQSDAP